MSHRHTSLRIGNTASFILYLRRSSADTFVLQYSQPLPTGRYSYPPDLTRDVLPIDCRSHNDYWRRVPFFEALHFGCTRVEADIWLPYDNSTNTDLLVGHKRRDLEPLRTFANLYVAPILDLLDARNAPQTSLPPRGIFERRLNESLVLLVDLKTNGYDTLPAVLAQLEPLRTRDYLSRFVNGIVVRGPAAVVATGETPFDALVANSIYRDVYFDAPMDRIYADSGAASSSVEAGLGADDDKG